MESLVPPSVRNNQTRRLQTKQRLIALPTAPCPTSQRTDPDRCPLHWDSLGWDAQLPSWLVTAIFTTSTEEGWTKTAKSRSERLAELQPVTFAPAWPTSHPERTLVTLLSTSVPTTAPTPWQAAGRGQLPGVSQAPGESFLTYSGL